MAAQKQDDQLERAFSSYVRIQAVVLKTYLGRWTIGRSGERGSGISVLPARYDDDDDNREDFNFPEGINPKVNSIARLEFELANYDVAGKNVNHYITGIFFQ